MTEQQTREERTAVEAAAHEYLAAGLSVLRIGREKHPSIPDTPGRKWESLQSERATPERLTKWYTDAAAEGLPASVGIVCGSISGNLLVVDFDLEAETIYPKWREHLATAYPELAAALEGAPVARTSKGYHVYVRLERPRGGKTLAAYYADTARGRKLEKLIETRGEGNYVVAPPSPHPSGARYTWLRPLSEGIPTLSPALEEQLIASCTHFDRRGSEKPAPRLATPVDRPAQTRPRDDTPTLEELRTMLQTIGPWSITYEEWISVLMAIHSAYPGQDGLALAEEWGDGKKGEISGKWKTFKPKSNGVGLGTLIHMALERGYKFPKPAQTSKASAAAARPSSTPSSSWLEEGPDYAAVEPSPTQTLPSSIREIVLVDSPDAAARLNAAGLSMRAVGLSGEDALTREQAGALRSRDTELVVVALRPERVTETLRALFRAKIDSILVAARLESLELAAAEEAIGKATRAAAWLVEHLLAEGAPATELDEERLLGHFSGLYPWLEERDPLQAETLLAELCERLDIRYEEIRPRLERAGERKAKEETRASVETLLAAAAQANATGDTSKARELAEAAARAMASGYVALPRPYTLAALEHDLLHEPESIPLPWKALSDIVKLPRAGLSVILAESGGGKSTMLLNLLERLLHSPKADGPLYFFTYEEPATHLAVKLILLMSGVELHPEQNYEAYKSYMRQRHNPEPYPATDKQRESIERAINTFDKATAAGRLVLVDTMPRLDELVTTLERITKRERPTAVFIDYVQRLPAPDGLRAQSRQLELAHIVQELRSVAVRNKLAIVTAAQITDGGDTREARDIFHEAQVVLKLSTAAQEGTGLKISVEKQRSGVSNVARYLEWDKSTLRIRDTDSGGAAATVRKRVVQE